ncbi:phenylalanine--tRNA ligase, mitochondrial-like [Octopus vulgaris]|uniref:Phenylalanine--tRNA ligase, mitochondrial n=1 Tax=Octopus vulgaris TaxID=6645 RepID=A0AA36BUR6_OCTVU|nr:phenylalanine--tRNA ligase, mitochondrial-like [Octopus vulgaris]
MVVVLHRYSLCLFRWRSKCSLSRRFTSSCVFNSKQHTDNKSISVLDKHYPRDSVTNISESIVSKLGENLHNKKHHPLNLIRQRIQSFTYNYFRNSRGNPLFSVYDNLSPVVTTWQNFDSLLVPADHVSRKVSDSYYINSNLMLRAHTSAHQCDLIRSGLDAFLVIGDVYRRDSIDQTHFPVFHQVEGVRLFTQHTLFQNDSSQCLFEEGERLDDKQAYHRREVINLIEEDLKNCLLNLAIHLFGTNIEVRWVPAYFPFTHPSWELEIKYEDKWMELLGCGIIEQEILHTAGAGSQVGWAFGLGLERLAMCLYQIPDIRLFWSKDSGFLSQFQVDDPHTPITYKPVSQFPQCLNDISFWLPDNYEENNFYELVREIGGNMVEQVFRVDEFYHSKKKRHSHCYRIVYRHLLKTLTQQEVNLVHQNIEQAVAQRLGGEVR